MDTLVPASWKDREEPRDIPALKRYEPTCENPGPKFYDVERNADIESADAGPRPPKTALKTIRRSLKAEGAVLNPRSTCRTKTAQPERFLVVQLSCNNVETAQKVTLTPNFSRAPMRQRGARGPSRHRLGGRPGPWGPPRERA